MVSYLRSVLFFAFLACLTMVLSASFSGSVEAQEQEAVAEVSADAPDGFFSREEEILIAARKEVLADLRGAGVVRPSLPSLLFLPGEHSLLQAAKQNFLTRIPSESEMRAAGQNEDAPKSVREITLGGIVYSDDKDWVIWINKQRVTPDALPEEIIDLSVHNDYINLKWFDAQTNKIFPVRLRPNQRFNFDARMFLPAG